VTLVESFWFYDPVEDRLLRQGRGGREEVLLTPLQHRLVAYMGERNRAEGGAPVLCDRAELIAAVWGDEPDHGPQDLAYLVHQLRARLAAEPDDPSLIVNERGRGYRVLLRDVADLAVPDTPGQVAPVRRSRRRLLAMGTAGVVVLAIAGAVGVDLWTRPPEPILREGSRGDAVLALQHDLADAGYDPVYLDGQYGPLTARAVRQFQQDSGVVVDGEVGQETRAALRRARDARRATPPTP